MEPYITHNSCKLKKNQFYKKKVLQVFLQNFISFGDDFRAFLIKTPKSVTVVPASTSTRFGNHHIHIKEVMTNLSHISHISHKLLFL